MDPNLQDPLAGRDSACFYHGICGNPPRLFQRSDSEERPYHIPKDSTGHYDVPPWKNSDTPNHPILKNELWKRRIALEIVELVRNEHPWLHITSMLPVRFCVVDDMKTRVYDDHIVLWISLRPGSTTPSSCSDANPGILGIFHKYGIQDIAIHWIEAEVKQLAGLRGPAMMNTGMRSDVTRAVRKPFTPLVSTPLQSEAADGEGTLGLFFYEGKKDFGMKGPISLMAVTNKHVLSKDLHADYHHNGSDSDSKTFVICCAKGRFGEALNDVRDLITSGEFAVEDAKGHLHREKPEFQVVRVERKLRETGHTGGSLCNNLPPCQLIPLRF